MARIEEMIEEMVAEFMAVVDENLPYLSKSEREAVVRDVRYHILSRILQIAEAKEAAEKRAKALLN